MIYLNNKSTINFKDKTEITLDFVSQLICHEFDEDLVVPALCKAINRHLSECGIEPGTNCLWWKIHEVCCYTLGLAREGVISHFTTTGSLEFDLQAYLAHWQMFPSTNTPKLLAGRSIWFAAKYAKLLTPQAYNSFVTMAITFLTSTDTILIVFAVR